MAKQSVAEWISALSREFIKAGAMAAHASLGAMVAMPEHINVQHPWALLQFGGTVFLVRGVIGALDYLQKDPIPLDEEPKP